ncbi:hypothetical protein GE061_003517 [Apolygus lucorum]|uniref:APCDD1 domain-containing protein n=1 Tax=Apolygus lucorum TaxID=248454 RepID=A0A8S9X293_APOLU|nr:hypothetical protein GE061_003517 [Apolygus lucorum]
MDGLHSLSFESIRLQAADILEKFMEHKKQWFRQRAMDSDRFTLYRELDTRFKAASLMALDMFNRANSSCPGIVMGRWTPDVQYVVYKHVEKNASTATPDELEKEKICMDFLQLSVKEMTLMRIQRRPPVSYDVWGQREELLLGEPRSKLTLFYDPLVRANQTLDCVPCQQVHKSTLLYPPKLKLKPPLPIHLSGEWISTRCEIRQNSLFLRRRLRVSGQSWHAEYWFYTDPLCNTPSLLAAAEGVYAAANEPEIRVQGAKDFDFEVQRAFLTVFDKGLVDNLQEDGKCGPKGTWQVAVTRDLTPSGGCPALGITLPTTEFELVRIEGDGAGNTLLFLGQSDDRTGPVKKRPTYFQPAMIQCSTAEFPLTHFLNSYNTAGIPRLRTTIQLVIFYSVFIFIV